ncbi:MAG TPA: hypothetical protein VFK16_10480 [Gemmatimonadaceae bacterium]|jgi:hypothetical protein|nr:hypothetical protein [Gemmatimonadaceae bacterium]
MAESLFDELAARVRRLPPAQRAQALAYVRALEDAAGGQTLVQFAGAISSADLTKMTAAIEAGCEQVDASEW